MLWMVQRERKQRTANIVLAIGGLNGFVSALVLKIPPIANTQTVMANAGENQKSLFLRIK
jgi:hypothetical protein